MKLIQSIKRKIERRNLIREKARMSRADVFDKIYTDGEWLRPGGTISGPGSSLEYTENFRQELPKLIERYNIQTVLDIPCGDLNWVQATKFPETVSYAGADISEKLIADLKIKFPDYANKLSVLDLVTDIPSKSDLIICRDCLFHLSNESVTKALENIIASDSKYVLTTSHYMENKRGKVVDGDFDYLNLLMQPWSLPEPLEKIDDYIPPNPPRGMLLWAISDLKGKFSQND